MSFDSLNATRGLGEGTRLASFMTPSEQVEKALYLRIYKVERSFYYRFTQAPERCATAHAKPLRELPQRMIQGVSKADIRSERLGSGT